MGGCKCQKGLDAEALVRWDKGERKGGCVVEGFKVFESSLLCLRASSLGRVVWPVLSSVKRFLWCLLVLPVVWPSVCGYGVRNSGCWRAETLQKFLDRQAFHLTKVPPLMMTASAGNGFQEEYKVACGNGCCTEYCIVEEICQYRASCLLDGHKDV